MVYDEETADRIRPFIPSASPTHPMREIKMFGGLAWTLGGHMVAGVFEDDLMVPVGADGHDLALQRGAHELHMGTQVMRGFVGVAGADEALIDEWIGPAIERALAKPPKAPKSLTKSAKSSKKS